ncbi:MAG: response regulator transcription factor [Gammaproteobacteria bacterium]|nr:response regulator transcription factor [Gammaproteobacteria bacterium]
MPKTIALVEDDEDQRKNYADAIKKNGYIVKEFADKPSALAAFQQELPDLAVLDIILGDEIDGGFDICRVLMGKSENMPIIFLTERIQEIDKISGLRMGAWDYLPKPISLDFLVERIKSLLRINEARSDTTTIQQQSNAIGDLLIDHEVLLVTWKGKRIELSGTEFRMLARLVKTPGAPVKYEELMDTTRHAIVTTNTINTHIRNIRRKFEEMDDQFSAIQSEYGLGYRWAQ